MHVPDLVCHALCEASPELQIRCRCRAAIPGSHLVHNDNEGRAVITDHGTFVLVNLYGPAVTDITAERFPRKLSFYKVCACTQGLNHSSRLQQLCTSSCNCCAWRHEAAVHLCSALHEPGWHWKQVFCVLFLL